MKQRVRAILITAARQLLTIRRERLGEPAYWVLPGGGVEPTDTDLEAALDRELREELGGAATIDSQILTLDHGTDREYFYLGRIDAWNEHDRTGPEFDDPTRGTYILDLVPLTTAGLDSISLKPDQVAELLRRHVAAGTPLFELPDLRRRR
ncbi:hypothetical protein GCM10010123_20310 [Pilimelia anulata]|uniref:Nudix hydrolase domain-containing protein n=1 Tax=Pilimelia anulata TaxID=53371 RepID=A0A8J3B2C4_9ACTN|nr:NUDIX domain-containing protein [Pilimelia anulata]GGJ90406.1 hypothetical protein GCM10010123_20310 [Pilimelia anulata]